MNTQHKRAVGVFNNHRDAETALNKLKNIGFDMNNVSVIAKDRDKDQSLSEHKKTEGNKSDEGAKAGAATGGIVGTLTGLLVGLGTLAIPGIGPIMLAGATATAVATTIAGGAIGAAAGGLVGALIGLGIPEEQAKVYNDRIAQGHYLVIVTGDPFSIAQAETIFRENHIEEWNVYDAPNQPVVPTNTNTKVEPVNRSVDNSKHTTPVEKMRDYPDVIIVDKRDQTHH